MMFPKHKYVRSNALMEAYRKIPCQHCGRDDGTVCGAHSNSLSRHKGRGIKASDEYCASLCASCHYELDQGRSMTRSERETMHTEAWRLTVRELVKRGIWPLDVAIPDTRIFQ